MNSTSSILEFCLSKDLGIYLCLYWGCYLSHGLRGVLVIPVTGAGELGLYNYWQWFPYLSFPCGYWIFHDLTSGPLGKGISSVWCWWRWRDDMNFIGFMDPNICDSLAVQLFSWCSMCSMWGDRWMRHWVPTVSLWGCNRLAVQRLSWCESMILSCGIICWPMQYQECVVSAVWVHSSVWVLVGLHNECVLSGLPIRNHIKPWRKEFQLSH